MEQATTLRINQNNNCDKQVTGSVA